MDGNILFVFKFSGGPIFYLGFSGGAAISLTFDSFKILTGVLETLLLDIISIEFRLF